MTPLKGPEFIRIKMLELDVLAKIIDKYKLQDKVSKEVLIYIIAIRRMYGFSQSGLLANKLFEKRLNKNGYYQSKYYPGLWKHGW